MIQATNFEFRIKPDILLEIEKPNNSLIPFKRITFVDNNLNQYVEQGIVIDDSSVTHETISHWNLIFPGNVNLSPTPATSKNRVNAIFSEVLCDSSDINTFDSVNMKYFDCNLYLRQGVSWTNVFGVVVVIRSNDDIHKVLYSQYFTPSHFTLNVIDSIISPKIINGDFWTYKAKFKIPRFDTDLDNVIIETYFLTYDNISTNPSNIGTIFNYPENLNDFEILSPTKPLPDYIKLAANVNANNMFEFGIFTTQPFKTLQQSILEYLDLGNTVVPIFISYLINYGTDSLGYKNIRIQNEDNNLMPLTIGLDMSEFMEIVSKKINVNFVAEIVVNGITMTRQLSVIYDYHTLYDPLIAAVYTTVPSTEYPVIVVEKNVIEQIIVENKTETKIVPIIQQFAVALVLKDFVYEPKNIVFDNPMINENSYMNIGNDIDNIGNITIYAKPTIDGTFYFNVNKVMSKPTMPLKYRIFKDGVIIQEGSIIPTK